MTDLQTEHQIFMLRWKADKKPVASYGCPDCGETIETPAPSEEDECWDTLTCCPACEGMHFKAVYCDGTVDVIEPPKVTA